MQRPQAARRSAKDSAGPTTRPFPQASMTHYVELYDTTLRDGTQAENFNLSVDDKIRITRALDELGIDFIEGGWPGSNPVSVEYFQRMQTTPLGHAKSAAFGATRHFKNPPE